MFAFQSPFITKFYTSRLLFLPRHHSYQPPQSNSVNLVRLPVRCAFDDTPKGNSNAFDTDTYPTLSQATVVTVQLPLDVYLEETIDGRAFIDELIPDGSAEVSGLLHEGDIIVAVSLPFSDGLIPVPKMDALEMIASQIATREGDSFTLAVLRTEPVQHLRTQTADNLQDFMSISEMQSLMQKVHISEYPIKPSEENDVSTSDTKFVQDIDALRECGFDLDDVLNSPDHET